MPKMNAGNRLYLYQLFSREIGVGKQARTDAYEEVLRADGLSVQDLDCETIGELMEALDEFCKLTVFKGGRVFATITANEEYDQALAKASAAAGKQSSGKSFKKRKGVKAARPVKPKHHEMPASAVKEPSDKQDEVGVPETRDESVPPSGAEAAAEQEADRQPMPAVVPHADEDASKEGSSAGAASQGDAEPVTTGVVEALSQESVPMDEGAGSQSDGTADEAPREPGEAEPSQAGGEPAASSDGKAAQGAPTPDASKGSEKPGAAQKPGTPDEGGRHIRLNITYNPYEGPDEEPAAPTFSTNDGSVRTAAFIPTPSNNSDGRAASPEEVAAGHRVSRAVAPAATASRPAPAMNPDVHTARTPRHDAGSSPASPTAGTVYAGSPATTTPSSAGQAAASQDMASLKHASPLTPAADAAGRKLVALRDSHPRRLSSDVHVSNDMLRRLYDVLPLDVEPLDELDRSWRRARTTGLLYGSTGRVTFSLGFLRLDGQAPATGTIKHVAKTSSGKSWDLAGLDLGTPLIATGEQGANDGGPATASPASPAPTQLLPLGGDTSLLDAMASLVCLGTWDHAAELVGRQLPGVTPERVRGYLPALASSIIRQQALAVAPDGAHAAFWLGTAPSPETADSPNAQAAARMVPPASSKEGAPAGAQKAPRHDDGPAGAGHEAGQQLYALLDRRKDDDIPWTLADVAAANDERLSVFDQLPQAPVLDPTLRLA